MNSKFDELAKSLAQSVTRRQAIKQFGVGLAVMALACFGLAPKGRAASPHYCQNTKDCSVYGASAVCCKWLGVKACAFSKSVCQHGKIIWV